MSSAVNLPNHTVTGQASSSKRLTSIVHILSQTALTPAVVKINTFNRNDSLKQRTYTRNENTLSVKFSGPWARPSFNQYGLISDPYIDFPLSRNLLI